MGTVTAATAAAAVVDDKCDDGRSDNVTFKV